MGRRPEIDWEPIKLMFAAGKSSSELSILFNVSQSAIMKQSVKDKWGELRKQVKAVPPTPQFGFPPKNPRKAKAVAQCKPEDDKELRFEVERHNSDASPITTGKSSLVERAVYARNADSFRERVIKQADKALETLEKAVVNNVFETDRFAEALTKVERIGARAYGYDREGEHPIINIGILGSGSEYDPV